MKRLKNNLIIASTFLVLLSIVACAPKRNETIDSKYPNGNKKLVSVYKDSASIKIKVEEKVYHENGKVMMQGHVDKNTRNGVWYSWYDDGTKWSETTFVNGKKNGSTKTWYPNGKMRYQGFFKNDLESGKWSFWDDKGKHVLDKDFDTVPIDSLNKK